MTKALITDAYSDENVLQLIPSDGQITSRPQEVIVIFNCPVRNVSLVSELSTTVIEKEEITIETVSICDYEHYLYNPNLFPNNITSDVYAVKFYYYFTDRQVAYIKLEYEKELNSEWISGSLNFRLKDCINKHIYEFDTMLSRTAEE